MTRATIERLRSGASVTEGMVSMAATSIGSDTPPMPATSVASTSRSGGSGSGGSIQVKCSGKEKPSGRLGVGILVGGHGVLEPEQGAGVDVERQVEVDGALAGLLGVEVDLPGLAQRVRLDEVALVVDVEAVPDGVVLQVGDEPGHVDDRHAVPSLAPVPVRSVVGTPACHYREGSWRGSSGEPAGSAAAAVLDETAAAIRAALGALDDWGLAGTRAGQHHSDLAADAAALEVLERGGAGVLSEESGLRDEDRPLLVVVDPLDGSTNAAHGIPWFATSLCARGRRRARWPRLVVNLVNGDRFEARRGEGAMRNGEPHRAVRVRDRR